MNAEHRIGDRESGSFLLKVVVIFALVGIGMTLATRIGPGIYKYILMRDLADRVVKDYAKLPVEEVRRRIGYEMNRSQLSEEDFQLTKTPKGYRVEVDYHLPLVLTVGEKEFSVPGHEEWVLTYKAE